MYLATSILMKGSYDPIDKFFFTVRDFDGARYRHGHIAVPDFLEYIYNNSSNLSNLLSFNFHNILQCLKCKWISMIACKDVQLNLYLPLDCKRLTLSDLLLSNSNATHSNRDSVVCGQCNKKTLHQSKKDFNPDIFFVEIIRVIEKDKKWVKNPVKVSFSVLQSKTWFFKILQGHCIMSSSWHS